MQDVRQSCLLLISTAPYLAIFEQGGSADIFSLITGGGGRDDTSKSVIVTLSNLWGGGGVGPTAPPLGTALTQFLFHFLISHDACGR